jgi:RHS repeat-associated protein
VTWEDGEVVESVGYDVYGKPAFRDATGQIISESAIGNNLTFTAREWDKEIGLYYYRFRTYDPYTGRFLQRDPFGYADGPSPFVYVSARPTAFVDPYGLLGGDVQNDSDHTVRVLIDEKWHDLNPGQSDDDIGGGDVDAIHDPKHPQEGRNGQLVVLKIPDGWNARIYITPKGYTRIEVSVNWFLGRVWLELGGNPKWVPVKEFGKGVKDP